MKQARYKKSLLMILIMSMAMLVTSCGFFKKKEKENKVEIPQRDYKLYVAVPMEYLPMRRTPGLESDVVTKIYPSTMLKEAGEPKEVNGTVFYYVSTLDGEYEGYCSENYCIEVSYEYSEEELNIVDTQNALYTYENMKEDLKEIVETYGEEGYLKVKTLGQSVEGREIFCVILGNPEAEDKIFIQAGIHGREYMTCQQVMKMVEYYAANYKKGYYENSLYSELFEHTALHIVPMANPDGVSISQFGEAAVSSKERIQMMREDYKRSSNGISSYEKYLTLWKANANGVDINRNFGAGWEDIHQNQKPGAEFFKGYAPDSEPETIILENQIRKYNYRCILNYHAMGQIIYYDVAGNTPELSQASLELASEVASVNKHGLVKCQDSASVVLGGLGDWAMLEENTPSITIEIGKNTCPLGSEEFLSIWHRGREVWAKVMKSGK